MRRTWNLMPAASRTNPATKKRNSNMTATIEEQSQGDLVVTTDTTTPPPSEQPDGVVEFPPYVSPTLLRLEARLRPSPSTICEACPASVWYTTADGVTAFCRVMHLKTWSSEEPKALESCDGEVTANMERIAQLMAQGG